VDARAAVAWVAWLVALSLEDLFTFETTDALNPGTAEKLVKLNLYMSYKIE